MKLDTERQRQLLILILQEVQILGIKAAREVVALEDAVLEATTTEADSGPEEVG